MSATAANTLLDQADAHIREGRLAEAEACATSALRADSANARAHFVLAVLQAESGRLEAAVQSYDRSLQAFPRNFDALANVGALHQRMGHHAHAVAAFRDALALRPEPVVANALGYALAKAGRLEESIAAYRQAVQLQPAYAQAWISLGEMLYKAHRHEEATQALDRAIALDPHNASVQFLRDSIGGTQVDHAPPEFVMHFFNAFADEFDGRVTRELEYQAPRVVHGLLVPWLGTRRDLRVADLGCGTGLSGTVVKHHASRLVGVDLSAGMLEKAEARGVYDQLEQGDVTGFLERQAEASFDLILALDVFVYVGRLDAVFPAAARVLAPGGRFAFTVESGDGPKGFELRRTGRYAHSRDYIERLAKASGLRILTAEATVIRKDAGEPIPGDIYILAA